MARVKSVEATIETLRFDRHELAGAVADLGVLVPIAVALVVKNGLEATAVLLPAGLLYLTVAFSYRLPVPVQPLKAFGAIAIAKGLGSNEIAAGALLMGVIFLLLGRSGLVDRAAKAFPRPLIRGVQLTVGLLFLKIAWGLVGDPPKSFDHTLAPALALPLGLLAFLVAVTLRRRLVTLAFVALGAVVIALQAGAEVSFGPSGIGIPSFDGHVLWTALTLLVIPQVPLTFANSCIATADTARKYFGARAQRVRPGALATTLGLANLLSGAIAGMPVCHGAGGMTAHRSFGARTAGAPLIMGSALIVLALAIGSSLAVLLASFPLPILAGVLGAAGALHIGLLRDLTGIRNWAIALVVGAIGFAFNIAIGLVVGLILWWIPRLIARPARAALGLPPGH